jgi:hypothetical protein
MNREREQLRELITRWRTTAANYNYSLGREVWGFCADELEKALAAAPVEPQPAPDAPSGESPCKCGHARSEHWHHTGITPPYERKADTVCHSMVSKVEQSICFCEKYEAAALATPSGAAQGGTDK